ncbi:carbonic anhydrase 12-like [Hippoglossus hippoglossus]|uniref:carbonic anhydrase 12-like n=1 Tax=Hippoglossus hippoglossus TaxID=8267 RepID=UPI00148D0E24|nr:carbonic anhydrase 12-like [Hippoglossus hippoglossus]
MIFLVALVLTACALTSRVDCATEGIVWCYHLPTCNDTKWATIAPKYCGGSRQSPININTAAAKPDVKLTEFTFTDFSSTTALKTLENTGKTVKVTLGPGVQISGGGLSNTYDTLQLHLHWGNGSSVPGSEHTVDGKRYPMELHIVNVKSSYNGNTTLAVGDSNGLAALGFFIEEMSGNDEPAIWKKFTAYLLNISNKGQTVTLPSGISLDDLLTGVNRTKYYRYLGSLTTPACNEAVVWTVFKEPIKVSKDLIDLFSRTVHVNDSSSPLMTNVFRQIQPGQPVTTQAESSASTTCYSLGLMVLSLALWKNL